MLKKTLLIVLLFSTVIAFSQIKFEKGYFIDKENNKVECLIKNESWNVNKGLFTYKVSENLEEKELQFSSINEISIYNKNKYKRFDIFMDTNIFKGLSNLSADKSSKYEKKSLLLKFILEGEATLYSNKLNKITRFFFSDDKFIVPKQLIYKKYLGKDDKVKIYDRFKQQIFASLKCGALDTKKIENLDYLLGDLTSFFQEYNSCKNVEYTIYNNTSAIKRFRYKIKAGVSYNSMNIDRVPFDIFDFGYTINFDSQISPIFGFEIEYFFPVKGNKWSIYLDPKYRSFSGSTTAITRSNGQVEKIDINYNAIEIPFNIRYYMYLQNSSKFSIDFGVLMINNLDSFINFEIPKAQVFNSSKEIKTIVNPVFGIGYHFNKFGIELKYSTRNIFYNSPLFKSDFNSIDLNISYSLF